MEPKLPGLAGAGAEPPPELTRALAARGAAYVPRAAHRDVQGLPRYLNQLIL